MGCVLERDMARALALYDEARSAHGVRPDAYTLKLLLERVQPRGRRARGARPVRRGARGGRAARRRRAGRDAARVPAGG